MASDAAHARFLPHVGHWTAGIAVHDDGAMSASYHLAGMAAELAGAQAIVAANLRDNQMDRNAADPRIELWDHFVRQDRQDMAALPAIPNWFAARFDAAYRDAQGAGSLYRNDLFLTVVMRPADTLRSGLGALFGASRGAPSCDSHAVSEFEAVLGKMDPSLARYGAQRLSIREKGGVLFSEIAEAMHLVLTGRWRPLGLTMGRLGHLILPERTVFGHREMQIVGEGEPLFAAVLSMKDYPARTSPVMFRPLRQVPFPITLTNSAWFRQKAHALNTIDRRVKAMQSGNDAGRSQILELQQDEDDVMSGRSVYVSHGFSAVVRASSLDELDRRVNQVQNLMSDAGVTAIRETDALLPAFYAQLPGNSGWRPRPGLVKSINAVAMAARHNVPRGQDKGRWGAPIINFRTTGDTEYGFHFHYQNRDVEDLVAGDVGSFKMFGGTGSGKTALLGTLSMLALRVPGARVVIVDKGLGLSVMVKALGGSYLPITYGRPTGFAPLRAYQNVPEDVGHLTRLLRSAILSDGSGDLSSDEDARLVRAIALQMAMPAHMRSIGGVAVMLGQRDKDGAAARLRKWCKGERLGWLLDNDEDRVDLSARIAGIDPSALFEDEVACAALLADFFYRVRKLIDGNPIMLTVDEAWQLEKVEAFRDDMQGNLQEIRKKEGIIGLATQNVGTMLRSPNAENYRRQIPTTIFFGDDSASRADLVDGLGLTEAEFLAVTQELPGLRRCFLLKRPSGSVLCRFDLGGMRGKLAVISARTKTYELMEKLITRHGDSPEAWVPFFEKIAPGMADDPTALITQEAAE